MKPPPPLIGLTVYSEPARWGAWDLPAVLTPRAYVDDLQDAGSRVVLLAGAGHDATLDLLDGVVFSGGPDLDPALYGAHAHSQTSGVQRERDDVELALMRGTLRRDLPVLGICRGMDLLNVARGGTLEQHLPDRLGADAHRSGPGAFARHRITTVAGSRLSAVEGCGPVASYHHQGVHRLAPTLRATAFAPDGVVEGLEDPHMPFVVGVLWHPEMGSDRRLFESFVAAAADRRADVEGHRVAA
jgi:putative glutamine amidotransferase